MSLFKTVMKAVKKLFKATVKRRPSPKKRHSKVVKRSKPPKPARRPVRQAPSKAVKPLQKKPKTVKKQLSKAGPGKTVSKAKAPEIKAMPAGLLIGEVTHYFDRIKVCVIRIDREHLKKGDRLLIKGPKGEMTQGVTSMQIENEDVTSAKKGQMIGLKVSKPVFVKDEVYKLGKN